MNETKSNAYFSFVEAAKAEVFFELVKEFNANQETLSKIHVIIMPIEKSN